MGDEGRKFLRYVMPGLVYGVETLLFLFIVMPEFTVCVLAKLINKNALGPIVGAFLASGALGYIFAAVHHWVHWSCCFECFEKCIFNHQPIIEKLSKKKQIILFNDEDWARFDRADKREKRKIAESFSLTIWYHYMKEKDLGKEQIDLLGHQAYGLGTARIASFFALITTVLLSWRYGTPNLSCWPIIRYFLMVLLGVCIILMFHGQYERIARFAQETRDKTLENEFLAAQSA